jgi:hypothetical protein
MDDNGLDLTLRYYLSICLEGLRKVIKKVTQLGQCP